MLSPDVNATASSAPVRYFKMVANHLICGANNPITLTFS